MQSLKEYITLEECKLLCNSKNDKDSFWVLKTYEANEIIYWKIWKQYKKKSRKKWLAWKRALRGEKLKQARRHIKYMACIILNIELGFAFEFILSSSRFCSKFIFTI